MLPIFDLRRFSTGQGAARRAFAAELARACEEVGFFYLAGHGVAPETLGAVRGAAEAFFALPRAEKLRVERPRGRYRGYIPPSRFTETAAGRPPVTYEAFLAGEEVGPEDPAVAASGGLLMPNIWPEAPEGFPAAVCAYRDALRQVAEELLRAFGLALCSEEDRLLHHFNKPLSNLSLLHYLPRPQSDVSASDDARAHYDTNALTVLLPGETGGLEALSRDGAWMEVPPREESFVVNLGNMLACWSGGRFKSTLHRVQPPLGVERYSLGYFAVPDYETQVTPLSPPQEDSDCTPIHAGKDLAAFVASCDAMVPAGEASPA
ncbi:MAG: 2-oxoglutarate and iron-dependent oxygenase domain-containing protein [Rhodovibrionaceae bacterium]